VGELDGFLAAVSVLSMSDRRAIASAGASIVTAASGGGSSSGAPAAVSPSASHSRASSLTPLPPINIKPNVNLMQVHLANNRRGTATSNISIQQALFAANAAGANNAAPAASEERVRSRPQSPSSRRSSAESSNGLGGLNGAAKPMRPISPRSRPLSPSNLEVVERSGAATPVHAPPNLSVNSLGTPSPPLAQSPAGTPTSLAPSTPGLRGRRSSIAQQVDAERRQREEERNYLQQKK
jgi:hypothetical protein